MRRKFKKILPWLIFLGLVLAIFKNWFILVEISAGDAPFNFDENFGGLNFFPLIWSTRGLGQFDGLIYSFPYLVFPIKILSLLGFSWVFIERLAWYWPFLILTIFSSRFLIKVIFPDLKFTFLAPFVYLTNSYILMIISGGQISIALSYALVPLVVGLFIKNIEKNDFKRSLISGLVLAAQVSFEPRIASLTMAVVLFYALLKYRVKPLSYARTFFLPATIAAGLHFYWILPLFLVKRAAYNPGLSSSDWVGFLSLAQFSQAFSLLHPLWPENIFGKSHFMRPEFLAIPLLAYGSLFFIHSKLKSQNEKTQVKSQNFKNNGLVKQRDNITILFFALLGLIGVFLAKGVNPPFGEIYSWLYNNFPGMNMFRDPTKFYTLVGLSYSVLIPFSVSSIYQWLNSKLKIKNLKLQFKFKNYLPQLFLIFIMGYFLFLIRPAWSGELGGTFKAQEVPQEYVELKNFISFQPEFFRTFWVPRKQRFGFFSNNHPALYASEFVSPDVCQFPLCELADKSKKPSKLDPLIVSETEILDRVRNYSLSYFNNPETYKVFAQMGVKYVIVPFDSDGEIFLRDRKYSDEEQEKYIAILDQVSWLKKVTQFEKNAVYETQNYTSPSARLIDSINYQDHFFAEGEKIPQLKWEMINPTKYRVEVKNAEQPFTLVFSEAFDPLWQARLPDGQAKIDSMIIPSENRHNVLNSFAIHQTGTFDMTIEFTAQKYIRWGLSVSMLTLIISGFLLLRRNKK